MIGVQFDACEKFGLSFSFDWCQLSHSSFYKLQIPKTIFIESELFETDFREADLTQAKFDNCNLERALFHSTNLQKADFRSAYNYSFNPVTNKLKKARFSLSGVAGLLDAFQIIIEDDFRKMK